MDDSGDVQRFFPHARLVVHAMQHEQPPLLGDEALCVRDALPVRIREFAAGRAAAREAMGKLGVAPVEVLQGAAGEPLWPEGLCGSISHTRAFAVALVARRTAYAAVGVDVDDDRPVGERAARLVTWKREIDLLQALGLCENPAAAQNLAFSAKEAVFKCQYPLTGCRTLHFQQVRLVSADGALGVSGWRVQAAVANALRRILLTPVFRPAHRIMCAFAPQRPD
jgi:4'-phosphopantetheinyl transferase EntD